VEGVCKFRTELSCFYKMLIILLMSNELLTALEGLRCLDLFRCTVKWKHLKKRIILRLEEVRKITDEDMNYVLSYMVHGARHKNCLGRLETKLTPET
jgi:hypothetical protein